MVASPSLNRASPLTIRVRGATGRGPTTLAAFDDALLTMGVANYNLVRLSSVIPPGSSVMPGSSHGPRGAHMGVVDLRTPKAKPHPEAEWGYRLYAVWAFAGAQLLGQEAWAGVAWAQDPEDGRGIFVEHEGGSETQVRQELDASLTHICRSRGLEHLEHQSVVVGTRCEGEPVGALVLAPFLSEPWPAGNVEPA